MKNWKTAGASVVGTSHLAADSACQDAHAFREMRLGGQPVFVAAVADGAGSAGRSAEGARLACEHFLIEVEDAFARLSPNEEFGLDALASCWACTRALLVDHASTEDEELEAFACTFLTVVVLPDRVLLAQIGDGAVVVRVGQEHLVPVWPQQGEFANTTNFLTGNRWEQERELCVLEAVCDAIVMFTDGMQHLILDYARGVAGTVFVEPLLEAFAVEAEEEVLRDDLEAFLSSERVNDRTDDDKTLLVGLRRSA